MFFIITKKATQGKTKQKKKERKATDANNKDKTHTIYQQFSPTLHTPKNRLKNIKTPYHTQSLSSYLRLFKSHHISSVRGWRHIRLSMLFHCIFLCDPFFFQLCLKSSPPSPALSPRRLLPSAALLHVLLIGSSSSLLTRRPDHFSFVFLITSVIHSTLALPLTSSFLR